MKAALVLLFCVIAFASAASVVELTEDNYEESLATGKWFVKYFAPWCGHCKRLAPTWEELASTTASDVNIAHVDCTVQKSICAAQGIRGYPTLQFHVSGSQPEKYSGKRDLAALEAFVSSK